MACFVLTSPQLDQPPAGKAISICALACRVTAAAAVFIGGAMMPSNVAAQTLLAPTTKAQTKTQSSSPAKKAPARAAEPCRMYGEGFIKLPGSDTCVKAGGYVRTDVVIGR